MIKVFIPGPYSIPIWRQFPDSKRYVWKNCEFYFEEPKEFTHIKKESTEESKVIKDWLAADPESHFDHTLSGKDNFLLLPEVFSMGVEDSDETV